MKLVIDKVIDLNGLHDELIASGVITEEVIVEGTTNQIILTGPDDMNVNGINNVVNNHKPDVSRAKRAKIEAIHAEKRRRIEALFEHSAITHINNVKGLSTKNEIDAYDHTANWSE